MKISMQRCSPMDPALLVACDDDGPMALAGGIISSSPYAHYWWTHRSPPDLIGAGRERRADAPLDALRLVLAELGVADTAGWNLTIRRWSQPKQVTVTSPYMTLPQLVGRFDLDRVATIDAEPWS